MVKIYNLKSFLILFMIKVVLLL